MVIASLPFYLDISVGLPVLIRTGDVLDAILRVKAVLVVAVIQPVPLGFRIELGHVYPPIGDRLVGLIVLVKGRDVCMSFLCLYQ